MRVLVGTSGYSYKQWKGAFYPEDLPDKQMLGFYASRLTTVEINNTFYRMPTPGLLEKWRDETPPSFTFVLKASQRITHQKRLKDAAEEVAYFFDTAKVLGDRLGAVLFQLPPYLKKDAARLRDFLAVLPAGTRAAFEFRHESWLDEEVYAALRERGAALCLADTDELGDALPPLIATAGFGYLRLRRTDYADAALRAWAERVRGLPWDTAFVFFKHEDEGVGARLAQQFGALFG